MLKEQLLNLAMKTLTQAHETKEKIKGNLKSDAVQNYFRSLRDMAIFFLENRVQNDSKSEKSKKKDDNDFDGSDYKPFTSPNHSKSKTDDQLKKTKSKTKAKNKQTNSPEKKERKSSIKPAKEISSERAEKIVKQLKKDGVRSLKKSDSLDGKKSLAYLVWALGHAHRSNITEGISIHDVSALLYRSNKINLYPINISRVVYSNKALIRQVGQEKRTKTYLLTEQGEIVFKAKFM